MPKITQKQALVIDPNATMSHFNYNFCKALVEELERLLTTLRPNDGGPLLFPDFNDYDEEHRRSVTNGTYHVDPTRLGTLVLLQLTEQLKYGSIPTNIPEAVNFLEDVKAFLAIFEKRRK